MDIKRKEKQLISSKNRKIVKKGLIVYMKKDKFSLKFFKHR